MGQCGYLLLLPLLLLLLPLLPLQLVQLCKQHELLPLCLQQERHSAGRHQHHHLWHYSAVGAALEAPAAALQAAAAWQAAALAQRQQLLAGCWLAGCSGARQGADVGCCRRSPHAGRSPRTG